MKENNIEKLQERLETLHVTQDARLACNADDLDIREEIAEVEEEIKELRDDTNVDRENNIKNERSSIEEDIKIVENYLANSAINETDSDFFKNGGWETVDLEIPKSMKHILSDYKRVLKENELLRKDIESWKKYCEEIEEEQTEMSNRNCELEFEVEKLQKEIDRIKSLDIYKLVEDWETGQLIPIQKIKDKIEELQKEYNKLDKQVDEYIKSVEKDLSTYYENKERISIMQTLSYFIGILQELIEESEE